MNMLSPALADYVALSVFAAGIVRGAAGFGFSVIMIVLLTLVCAPAEAAPVILMSDLPSCTGAKTCWARPPWCSP